MSKKKYIVILSLLLLSMLCMVGASAWIIANPFTVTPLWRDSKPKFYVNKTVELDYGAPHSLGDIKKHLVFLDESGEDITSSVGTFYIREFTDGETTFPNTDSITANMGTTYRFELDLPNAPAEYAFGGTYASYDGAAKALGGIEEGDLRTTALLFKYKTVRLNDEWYTVEDALARVPETVEREEGTKTVAEVTAEGGSKETIAIIEHDTAFAHPDVARAAGYLDADGNPQNNCYSVRGTLLVPYASTAVGFLSTGLMDSETVDDPGTADDDARKSDPVIRANAKTFTQDYGKQEPPAPYEKEPYVTLALPNGVALSVTGRLVVNAIISSSNGNTSRVNGDYYGELTLEQGASLSLESGSTFDCMGFTCGAGELVAKDGASVFEPFNMSGWKGGGETLAVYGAGVFPLAQYTVASLVAKTVFQKGSVYSLRAFVAGTMGDVTYACAEVKFISARSSQGVAPFLQIDGGTVTKEVNETKGKLHFIADGDIFVNNLGLEVMGMQVSTLNRDVPVPGHLEMVINSGTTTIPEGVSLKMLPGANVRIEKGATLVINGKALSYGATNGGEDAEGKLQQGKFRDGSLSYPIPRLAQVYRIKPEFDYTDEKPARVIVNGKLIVRHTETATPTVAAEIESEGGGVADIDSKATLSCIGEDTAEETDNRVVEYGPEGAYKVVLTSKWWNGNETPDTVLPGLWKYIDKHWIGPSSYTVHYHLNNGTLDGEQNDVVTKTVEDDVWSGQMNAFVPATPTREHYFFEGWYLDEACEKDRVEGKAQVKSGEEIHLYAKWSPITYTVYGCIPDEAPRLLGTWTCEQPGLTLAAPDVPAGLTFFGWYLSESATGELLQEINETTVDKVLVKEEQGASVELYLFGRFADAEELVSVTFEYERPADNYPAIESITVKDIPLDWTFAQAGMPAIDLHQYDDELSHEYYFEGWCAEDGSAVSPETVLNRALDQDADGTVTVTAKWSQKYRLTITLARTNKGDNNSKAYAYVLGFELVYGDHPPVKETYDSKADRTDSTEHSQEYTFWFKPGESFNLRFFYDGGEYNPDVEETTEPKGGEILIENIDGNYSYKYTAAFRVNSGGVFTFAHVQTLTGGKEQTAS